MGFLHIISGSMFSSKTTTIIKLYNDFKHQRKRVISFNHMYDNRYNESKLITTHDKISIESQPISSITEIFRDKNYSMSDIIIIDEGQFFDNLFNSVMTMVENDNKHVIISGLLLDTERNKFGEMSLLIPYADQYQQLYSKCFYCQENGLFTDLIHDQSKNKEHEIIVGSDEKYIPVCRYHYLKKRNKVLHME